ncbi:ABC transporter ATP-binding protein [Methanobrevibacter sp. DSM 116169]|uniref:ABC transporter ATP-binding protein n=1 Tax=Methanobrevibacter sp. DSM 116169 TaxID=3242727 RepID=UPI0038FC2D79
MEYAIECENLTKTYRNLKAVDNLNLKIPKGKVYGFLGRNGSGKTTTIRMIMNIIKADSGTVKINGKEISRNNTEYLSEMGAIIENPGFYSNLSAYENLEITCELFNSNKKEIEKSLKVVGLDNIDNRSTGKFSLGMKQRLGIANALIHSPNILILDEPTNGLDPLGIIEMRKLIRKLSENYKITIMVSSHLLSEIQLIADYVGIIDKGKLIKEGNIRSINANEQNFLILEINDNKKAQNILNELKFKYTIENGIFKVFCDLEDNPIINEHLVNNGLKVYSLNSHLKTLEERFLGYTN